MGKNNFMGMFPCSTPKIKEIPKELGLSCGAVPWEPVHWRCGNLFLMLKNNSESWTCLWPLLSVCWISVLQWLCWGSYPRNPSVNWVREIINFQVLASLSGGDMGKKSGEGREALSLLWRPVLASCVGGISGDWEWGAFLHWLETDLFLTLLEREKTK